jgi:hypothetical protein
MSREFTSVNYKVKEKVNSIIGESHISLKNLSIPQFWANYWIKVEESGFCVEKNEDKLWEVIIEV